MKPSVIHSLASGLESIFDGSSTTSRQAGWILFQFASSSQFQLLGKDTGKCCEILIRLCRLGIPSAQAIAFQYCSVYGRNISGSDPQWLEAAAAQGSYYALESLHVNYPEKYRHLMHSGLNFEPDLSHIEECASLLRCMREGD